MNTKKLIYVPSAIEKEQIDKAIRNAIDCFSVLDTNQKAFALTALVQSFEDIYGMHISGAELD